MDKSSFRSIEIVEVLDKNFRVIFTGPEHIAFDWICENPLGPEMVWLKGYSDLMTIDEWVAELDSLHDE